MTRLASGATKTMWQFALPAIAVHCEAASKAHRSSMLSAQNAAPTAGATPHNDHCARLLGRAHASFE